MHAILRMLGAGAAGDADGAAADDKTRDGAGDPLLLSVQGQASDEVDDDEEAQLSSGWRGGGGNPRSGPQRVASVHRLARSSRSNVSKDGVVSAATGGSGSISFFVRQRSCNAMAALADGGTATAGGSSPTDPGMSTTGGASSECWELDAGHLVNMPHELVHDTIHGAVGDAVAAALEDHRFDFRANAFTLVAITGVILYWRGVWTMWDKLVGMSLASEVACILVGLSIMTVFRFVKLPLLEGLPSG